MPSVAPKEISSVVKRSYSPETRPKGMPSRLTEARCVRKGSSAAWAWSVPAPPARRSAASRGRNDRMTSRGGRMSRRARARERAGPCREWYHPGGGAASRPAATRAAGRACTRARRHGGRTRGHAVTTAWPLVRARRRRAARCLEANAEDDRDEAGVAGVVVADLGEGVHRAEVEVQRTTDVEAELGLAIAVLAAAEAVHAEATQHVRADAAGRRDREHRGRRAREHVVVDVDQVGIAAPVAVVHVEADTEGHARAAPVDQAADGVAAAREIAEVTHRHAQATLDAEAHRAEVRRALRAGRGRDDGSQGETRDSTQETLH